MDAPMAVAKNHFLSESLCYLSVDIVVFRTVLYFPRFHILLQLLCQLSGFYTCIGLLRCATSTCHAGLLTIW